jgi:hypothetical protein
MQESCAVCSCKTAGSAVLNQTTGRWNSAAHVEKTQTVRSERSRVSGEVEECHAGGDLVLRLRCATLRTSGDEANCQ